MKINSIKNFSFKRAFTSAEKRGYEQACKDAQNALYGRGNDRTIATIFDVQVPKSKYDMGMGTMYGKDAQELAGFLKGMFNITGIQLAPQGEISNFIKSPYSGTSFSIGSHLIDPEKLVQEGLLTAKDIEAHIKKGGYVQNNEVVQYTRIFDENVGHEPLIRKAYKNFQKIDGKSALKQDFEKFKKNNEYWLHKDALYEACAVKFNAHDMNKWPKEYQNVFDTKEGNQRLIKILEQTDDKGDNVVDYHEFIQFIADRQLKEAKDAFNKAGVDIYTDCPVAFSQKDYWAHKSAFHPVLEFGCDGMGDNKYNCWGAAPDFSKLRGEAGELLRQKFDMAFSRYNGVRVDAAWQYINPMIVEPLKNTKGESVYIDGNKMGRKVDVRLPHKSFIVEDIIMKSADKHHVPRNKVFFEMLGGNSYDGLDVVKASGGTLIHISRYGDFNWGNPVHYETQGTSNKYQGMKPGQYIFGIGAHDDPSAIHQAKYPEKSEQYGALAKHLHLKENNLRKSHKDMLSALYAQTYTTSSRFFTLPDILGQDRRINTPNTQDGNWEYRAPDDTERTYYENVADGCGLNLPDALSKALKAKHGNQHLIHQLEHYASILKENWDGAPMTTYDADARLNVKV